MSNFKPQHEPAATVRQAAGALHDYYVALVQAGFTEAQALQILGVTLSAALGGATS